MPKTLLIFFISLICTLSLSVLFPSCRLLFFPSFLIILYYQKSYTACLWCSLLCGLILDLLAFQTRFGLHAIAYCLTTIILYNQRRNFFADSLSTIPILTYLFSAICTLLQGVLMNIFDKESIFSLPWFGYDLLFMPLFDALFGWSLINLPTLLFKKRPKRGKDYFTQQRRS